MNIWHITIAHSRRAAVFASPEVRVDSVRRLCRVIGGRLLFFCIADDHLHIVVVGVHDEARDIARGVHLTLRPIVDGLAPAHFTEVKNRAHLLRLLPYVLDQTTHHDIQLATHPATWEGSAFQDIVGARFLGYDPTGLRSQLPRLSLTDICTAVRLPALEPLDDIGGVPLSWLVEAGTAACGGPLNARTNVGARVAVVQLAGAAGWSGTAVRERLQLPARTFFRAQSSSPDRRWDRAIRLQLALRSVTVLA